MTLARRVRADAAAVLGLVRWPNAAIAAAGVLIGAWWGGGSPIAPRTLLAAACAIALTAFANAENDRRDVDIDRVVHPERPLPAGRLSPGAALAVVAGAALAALVLALLAGGAIALATPLVLLLMLAYSARLKRHGVLGNVVVAVLASLPFLYGGWSAGTGRATLALVALAIPLHLAREIAKDLDDAAGDAPVRRTLPVASGPRAARAALVVSLLLFAAVLVPFAMAHPRVAVAVLPALLLAAAGARRALASRRGAPALLKAAMVCAMASLLVAR